MKGRLLAWLWGCLAATLSALPARADIGTPYAGTRSLSMGGATRALGIGNDALMFNPAAMAASRRYGAQLTHATGADHQHRLLASTVDSQTSQLAAGVSFMRTWGNPSGVHPRLSEVHAGLAYSPFAALALGVSGQSVNGAIGRADERKQINAFNSTIGALLHLGEWMAVGISWENFVAARATPLLPKVLGLGAAVSFPMVRAAADMRFFPAHAGSYARDLSTGLEWVFGQMLCVRGGYRLAMGHLSPQPSRVQWATGGLGLAAGAFGIDASFELPIHSREWRIGTGLSWVM